LRFAPLVLLSLGIALAAARGLPAQDGQVDWPSTEALALEACEARGAGFERRAEVDRRKVNELISVRDTLQRQLDDCSVATAPEADLDRANALLDALEAQLAEIEASLE
jgi:hypothetical protein